MLRTDVKNYYEVLDILRTASKTAIPNALYKVCYEFLEDGLDGDK